MSATPAAADAGRAGGPRPYADPYVAGVGLGLVLLAAFVIAGRGLGASGAFASTAAAASAAVSPTAAHAQPYFARYFGEGGPWRNWLLVEIVGVVCGAFVSAWLAGRLRVIVERGAGAAPVARLLAAGGGGAAMGVGAVLARGCTSGQALSGGALLSVGSWIFVATAFAAAYLVAPLVRRAWR